MDGRNLIPDEIAAALARGATVVTGNQRAARTLQREFDRRNRAQGLGSWRPPAVLPWDAWTATLWHRMVLEGHTSLLLLNRTQEHAVWRAVLEADEELASLRTVDSLAEMAAEAWALLWSYEGQGHLPRVAASADTRAFRRWARVFHQRCRNGGFLSRAQLAQALRSAVESKQLPSLVNEIVLVGFDAMLPAQGSLLESMRGAGIVVDESRLALSVESRVVVGAIDEAEELSVAARWLRNFVEKRPKARIAVIVPSLAAQRAEIERVFREVLAPELEDIQVHSPAGPYEFSLGVALTQVPFVAVALDLLQWAIEPLPVERISALLLSPFFCMKAEERAARAEFDAFELRRARMMRPEVSLESLRALVYRSARRPRMGRLPDALTAMRHVAATRLNATDRRSHAEWAERMQELLAAAGWGTAEPEDSVEFQARRRWEDALDELATLDFDSVRIGFADTLQALVRIAQKTIFAPESRDAPVQIMGPLEAAGSRFDAIWFLRCGDLSWPMAPIGSPLLSWQMKKELRMPGADLTRDTEAAQQITRRIAESAATVIFSYAKESAEGKQRPSPLLASLAFDEVEVAQLLPAATQRTIVTLEETEDDAQVRALPDRVIHGGARILELQAACGFRAFAETRLWSSEVETMELGIDARQSGTVVHRVLESFWDAVKTQNALKAMSLQERAALLDACIVEALGKIVKKNEAPWDDAYAEMQRARLHRLLGPWLQLELERGPFEVMLSEKKFEDVRVGPLRLNVRMDRVDRIDGGEVLIDYKTGSASPNDWLTDRPRAPQLPLYAILSDVEQLQGVALGLVRAGDGIGLIGYGVHEDVLPKLSPMKTADLSAQVEEWRRVLVGLAEDFASGEARVAPNHYPATCEHCAQRLLCRLDVSHMEEDDSEDAALAAEVDRD